MADTKISALTASTTPLAGTEVLPIVQSGTTKQVSVANLTAGRAVSMLSATAGNVQVSGNTVTTTDTNGNLTINPNGSGYTVISAPTNGTYVHYFDQASRSFYVKQANITGYDNDTLIHESDSGVGQFQWKNSGGILATLSDAGNLTLPAGNLVIGTSGKGIDFSATPGTGTSELLNDYEEGTWTPSMESNGQSGSFTFTAQTGTYTKIGRMVYGAFDIAWSAKPSVGATLRVSGLPFAWNSSHSYYGACVTQSNGVPNTDGLYLRVVTTGGGAYTAFGIYMDGDNAIEVSTGDNISSSGYILATFMYMV
jgi:hypothetical protein